jgi:hypothetical protein
MLEQLIVWMSAAAGVVTCCEREMRACCAIEGGGPSSKMGYPSQRASTSPED